MYMPPQVRTVLSEEAVSLVPTQVETLSVMDRVRRIFAKPGPKPNKQTTYRGRMGYHLNAFMQAVEWKPSGLTYDTLDRMRRNGQVQLGLAIKDSPVYSAMREAEIECEDADVRAFLNHVFLRPLLMPLTRSSLTSHVFGAAFHEKVFDNVDLHVTYKDDDGAEHVAYDGVATVPRKIMLNNIATIKDIRIDKDTQDYRGYIQRGRPGKRDVEVEDWKSFVFALNTVYGGLWGEATLWYAYPYWYYLELFRALQADWLRTRAINPIIARAPTGTIMNQDDEEVDQLVWAGTVIRNCYDSMVVSLPNTRDELGNYIYDYDELDLSSESGAVYQTAIENLGTMVLRSLVVPERTTTQAVQAGGYNEAKAHVEAMVEAAKQEIELLVQHIDRYIFPQLIEWNFKDRFTTRLPKAYLNARTISEDLKTKLMSVLIAMLQNDSENGRVRERIAAEALLEHLNIPGSGEVVPIVPVEKDDN